MKFPFFGADVPAAEMKPLSFLAALILGIAAGALHLYLRFLNNTQGEMVDAGGKVDFAYCGLLFSVAFVLVFLVAFAFGSLMALLVKSAMSRSKIRNAEPMD